MNQKDYFILDRYRELYHDFDLVCQMYRETETFLQTTMQKGRELLNIADRLLEKTREQDIQLQLQEAQLAEMTQRLAQAEASRGEAYETIESIQQRLDDALKMGKKCPKWLRDLMIELSEGCCLCCGTQTPHLQMDRIWPGMFGGTYVIYNVQPLCYGCHRDKGTNTGDGWDCRSPEFLQKVREALERSTTQQDLFEQEEADDDLPF